MIVAWPLLTGFVVGFAAVLCVRVFFPTESWAPEVAGVVIGVIAALWVYTQIQVVIPQ